MKKALFLAIVAIVAIGCKSEKDKQIAQIKESVQHYMLTESDNVEAALLMQALGTEVKFKMEMLDFNSTPIDTITDGDLYRKKIENAQNEIDASLRQIAGWREVAEYDSASMNTYAGSKDNLYKKFYNDHLERYNEAKNLINGERIKMDSINNVISAMRDTLSYLNHPAYYVYQFSEELKMNHPVTDELTTDTITCYAYINANTLALVKVDEDKKTYQRDLDKLQ